MPLLSSVHKWEEDKTGEPKKVFVIFGSKGVGKTAAALAFDGPILAISMDDKTIRVKMGLFQNDPRVTVISGTKFMTYEDDKYVEGGKKTHEYLCWILDQAKGKGPFDYVLIDGFEKVKEACELVMRYKHKLGPFENFANPNFWKSRKLALREILHRALQAATKGVIFTTYSEHLDEVIEAGQVVKRKPNPKWFDIVEEYTDIMIRVWSEPDRTGLRFMTQITSSKFDEWPTGLTTDLTKKKWSEVLTSSKQSNEEAKQAVDDLFK